MPDSPKIAAARRRHIRHGNGVRGRPAPPLLQVQRHLILDCLIAAAATLSPLRPHRGHGARADAHNLFDELLRQPTAGVTARAVNGFLAALSRAPPSATYGDGPALAVALFNRISRAAASSRVGLPTVHTYGILINCCGRAHIPDLALAFFGRLLRTDLGINIVTCTSLLKSLCDADRTNEALDVLVHRMPELGCVPDVVSYSVLLKSFCNQKKSHWAVDLLRTMAKKRGVASPNVVSYSTVVDGLFKDGKVAEACDLFHEMMRQGIQPDVFTYNSIVHALCKARAMDKAEVFFRQMVDKGVQPNIVTYANIIHGYSTLGQWKEAFRKRSCKK
nr:unnamed protein product [Digitaria exilis]